jgi:hypothetical protein
MIKQPLLKRIVIALGLALLAVGIPSVRSAVVAQIDARQPAVATAGGFADPEKAAR